jgi:hypothetical protein
VAMTVVLNALLAIVATLNVPVNMKRRQNHNWHKYCQ